MSGCGQVPDKTSAPTGGKAAAGQEMPTSTDPLISRARALFAINTLGFFIHYAKLLTTVFF
jgi:hypothetical protein